jgi:methylthioribose-1-phosphate isomerase
MDGAVRSGASDEALLEKALGLHEADVAGNARIGEQLLARLTSGMNVLTHCNAGALATGGLGTALAGLFLAQRKGLSIHVWVSETRPRLQGARLTAFELTQANVPCTLITDNMAASLMAKGKVDLVVTGADRVAKNGDVANKIGTSMHAVCAKHFGVPFHVAAPFSTFDPKTAGGKDIVIEEREPDEVTTVNGERLCPSGMKVYNPSFDVTPAGLIRSLFTDKGEVEPVTEARLTQVLLAGGDR